MDNELDAELYDDKNMLKSNDKSYSRSRENTPDKIKARHENKCQKDGRIGSNVFQMKTYGKPKKIEVTKPQNTRARPKLSQSNKTASINLTHHSILSSASSSENDVFQTRYSTFDNHDYEKTDNTVDYALNLIDKNSDEEDTLGNISNLKKSPVIIEAKAFEEKNYPFIDKQIPQIKKQRETTLLKDSKNKTESRDLFREDVNNSNTIIKSNSVQISDDGFDADLDFSDNISTGKSNKKCMKEMMVDVTVTPKRYSASKNTEKSRKAEDIICEDIFNGSFDVTAYRSDTSSETKEFLNDYENSRLKSIMQTNGGNKRKIKELATANKRVKHETILESKNKKNIMKTGEGANKLHEKPLMRKLNGNKKLNSYQKSNTFSNKIQPPQKKTKEKFDSFNININFLGLTDSPYENRQIKLKNCHENKNIYDTEEDTIKNKYSRRTVRSSSRIASKKIKEIEKIENLSDIEEIEITDKEETETNIYDDLLNSLKDHNCMETSYSSRRNSNTSKAKTASANRKKETDENKNSKMSMQHENGFFAMKEREDIVQHSEINKMNTKYTDAKLISRPIIHLLKLPHSSKIPMKQNTCIDKKNQASSLNSFYSYMAKAGHNLTKDNQTFEKRSKIDNSKNSDLIHHSNRFFMGENSQTEDTNDFTVSKEYTKESKPRTWEVLENDLLKDLDNEQLSDNVYKTVILKKQETVMKKEVAKDRNLFTVSNTSMLQTISKSKTGNNYNLKYEIKNIKSKFVGSKTDPPYNFKNTTIAQQMNRKDSNFKSNAIVNKTITAMEKCAAKFITPEVKLCNADNTVSNWQLKNLSDNSDTHQERQFHSHMTFTTHDDKKYYSKEIVGYTKKSNKDQKSFDFDQKDMSKAISNLSGMQRNTKGSQKALCTEYSYNSNKSNLPTECLKNLTTYDKTQALVPCRREKNNPWENLIDKLHLQEKYQGSNEVTSISNCEIKDQSAESPVITKTSTQNSNNFERNETLLIETDYEVDKTKLDETLSDQHLPADVQLDTEQSKIHMPKTKNISLMKNLTSRSINHENSTEKTNVQENKEICRKLEQQKISKNKIPEEQIINRVSKNAMKSPSFKFKLNKHGALKLKKHSSASSSSKLSEDSMELKKTKLHKTKASEGSTSVTNKAREKYKTYLKELFDNQNSVIDKDDKTKSAEENTVSNKNILKEPLKKSQNNLRKTRESLIAKQEDDIFSLSSSSSDDESLDTSKKNYGTGPICDLFDE